MKWVVVKKEAIRVNDSMEVPNVVSHAMEKAEALRWIMERGLQRECKITEVGK